MTFQTAIHATIELAQMQGRAADQLRTKFSQSASNTRSVRGQVEWSEWADFAVASQAGIGFNLDDGTVKDFDGFSAGPFVAALVQRQVNLVGADSSNLHDGILTKKDSERI